jgi:carboxypeptidase C (cathepsin A)
VGINKFSWNNRSNNLFIEAPAGVGFSYCETASGCAHTDTSTAADNLASIVSFFTAYPELAKNDYWIAGESYAGG